MKTLKKNLLNCLLPLAILLSGTISGQTSEEDKIYVDRDSLYNVFMNFEAEKAKVESLQRDTVIYRTLILSMEAITNGLKEVVKNNDSIVVPGYQKINENLKKQLVISEKDGKAKYWKGGRDWGIIGILIGIIISSI